MAQPKIKFSAQADPALWEATKELAKKEGRQLHSVIDEALTDLLEKRNNTKPRPEVMMRYQASLEKFDSLYKRLAK